MTMSAPRIGVLGMKVCASLRFARRASVQAQKMRPQANNADDDQVDRHDEIQQSWHEQDQNTGNERDKRLNGNNVNRHAFTPCCRESRSLWHQRQRSSWARSDPFYNPLPQGQREVEISILAPSRSVARQHP